MALKNKYLIVVAGPTAIGKTALAIKIAQHFSTEILSADSRQFYKELNIGVAKPSGDELAMVPHHFIGHIPINHNYTAAEFEREALHLLDNLFTKHDVLVLAGGSGLFINALLNGLDNLPSDKDIREQLNQRFETDGLFPLAEQLKSLDEETYQTIDVNNPRRVIRALEICLASGKKASELKIQNTSKRNFTPIKIALNTDRELLYQRINQRVDSMIGAGQLEEAKTLFPHKELNALQTVGYKELFDYFDNSISLEKAIELIKQHTRNYAKRQLTWFRKDEDYKWFSPADAESIIGYCESIIR